MPKRIRAMRLARERLLDEVKTVFRISQKRFTYPELPTVVIYVGLGLGAGWATSYRRSPSILFGLENIAGEGWTDAPTLKGLVAHELSHLMHDYWRKKAGRRFGSSPLWQLYIEGFADRCERRLVAGSRTHVTQGAVERNREPWCENNQSWLAGEFLRRTEKGIDIRPFFGSWLQIRGHSQTGYFLGSEIIAELEKEQTLEDRRHA